MAGRMTPVSMAESTPEPVEGAPIPKDAIDPELIKLSRPRPKVGIITAAGLVFLSVFFVWRLNADRRFGGAADAPTRTTVADVLAGKVATDAYVAFEAEPLVAHAIRTTTATPSSRSVQAPAATRRLSSQPTSIACTSAIPSATASAGSRCR